MQRSSWYYAENQQSIGPLSDDQMHDLFNRGVINRATMIWKNGMPNWITVAQLFPENTTEATTISTTTTAAPAISPVEPLPEIVSNDVYSNYLNTSQDQNLEIYRPGALNFYIIAGLGLAFALFLFTTNHGAEPGVVLLGVSLVIGIIGYFAHRHAWVFIVGIVICSAAGILGVIGLSANGTFGRFIIIAFLVNLIRSFRNTSLRQRSTKK